jgi:hypothetical protein
MQLYARHGDLVIEKTNVTGDLEKGRDIVFAGDSSGHPHTLLGACLYRKDGRSTFIRLAEATKLQHGKPDGHETISMEPGDYEIRPLRERGDGLDRAVED